MIILIQVEYSLLHSTLRQSSSAESIGGALSKARVGPRRA
jgi:hypothetical protein